MKALCLVAHPDDCVIFAYSYIHNHPQYQWTIGYLTYTAADPRGAEIAAFWQRRSIPTVFLGFEDHWHDNEQQAFTRWSQRTAMTACADLAQSFDLVLTHAADGDYGHIHHKLVHHSVRDHPKVMVFSPLGEGQTYTVPESAYSLEELPLHSEIIYSFHRFQHKNSYEVLK